jgi:hydroxyacylglutathione hydrolase
LIADTEEQISEARVRLARVGIDAEPGYIVDTVGEWVRAGFTLDSLPQIAVQELADRKSKERWKVLDVRREPEWKAGHIADAELCPLDKFARQLPWLDKSHPIAVHCKSGYRSTIACSLLKKAGYENVINVVGGFDAWSEAQLPFKSEP